MTWPLRRPPRSHQPPISGWIQCIRTLYPVSYGSGQTQVPRCKFGRPRFTGHCPSPYSPLAVRWQTLVRQIIARVSRSTEDPRRWQQQQWIEYLRTEIRAWASTDVWSHQRCVRRDIENSIRPLRMCAWETREIGRRGEERRSREE